MEQLFLLETSGKSYFSNFYEIQNSPVFIRYLKLFTTFALCTNGLLCIISLFIL